MRLKSEVLEFAGAGNGVGHCLAAHPQHGAQRAGWEPGNNIARAQTGEGVTGKKAGKDEWDADPLETHNVVDEPRPFFARGRWHLCGYWGSMGPGE